MNYTVIKPPTRHPDIEKHVMNSIENAIKEGHRKIVLDLGEKFNYNSTILSQALVHKDRIIFLNPTERFKVILRILKVEHLICVVDSLDTITQRCVNEFSEHCELCRKNILIKKEI